MTKLYPKIITLINSVSDEKICGDQRTIRELSLLYESNLNKRLKHRGKNDTIRHYKELYVVARSIALEIPFEPMKFTKAVRGIPNELLPYVSLLKSGKPHLVRRALTLLSLYKLLRSKPSFDTSSITEPGKILPDSFISEFEKSSSMFKTKYRVSKFIPRSKYQWRNPGRKSGPNGPALHNSHFDNQALMDYPELRDKVQSLLRMTNQSEKVDLMNCLPTSSEDAHKFRHSKLSFLSEEGGKTRVVAIGDLFSQQALYPIHIWLSNILSQMDQDGT